MEIRKVSGPTKQTIKSGQRGPCHRIVAVFPNDCGAGYDLIALVCCKPQNGDGNRVISRGEDIRKIHVKGGITHQSRYGLNYCPRHQAHARRCRTGDRSRMFLTGSADVNADLGGMASHFRAQAHQGDPRMMRDVAFDRRIVQLNNTYGSVVNLETECGKDDALHVAHQLLWSSISSCKNVYFDYSSTRSSDNARGIDTWNASQRQFDFFHRNTRPGFARLIHYQSREPRFRE